MGKTYLEKLTFNFLFSSRKNFIFIQNKNREKSISVLEWFKKSIFIVHGRLLTLAPNQSWNVQ